MEGQRWCTNTGGYCLRKKRGKTRWTLPARCHSVSSRSDMDKTAHSRANKRRRGAGHVILSEVKQVDFEVCRGSQRTGGLGEGSKISTVPSAREETTISVGESERVYARGMTQKGSKRSNGESINSLIGRSPVTSRKTLSKGNQHRGD